MEYLTPTQEESIQSFARELDTVFGVDDLFPPDSGVPATTPPPRPLLPGNEALPIPIPVNAIARRLNLGRFTTCRVLAAA
jgi:hypothetical protein